MSSNGYSTLKSLLSSVPQCTLDDTESVSPPSKDDALPQSSTSYPQKSLNQKEKKKAAFENWHKRKLDELQLQCNTNDESEPSTESKRNRTTSDSCSVSSTTPDVQVQSSSDFALFIQQQLKTSTLQAELSKVSFPNNVKLSRASKSSLASNKDLTSPKLSRHNDAAFYPNIQCILCKEWVCSRNRYMHIESHLQYRPYKCSVCNYDNRKKIFIELHINKIHKGASNVVYQPDPELEKRAWIMAEQCLQHTREVLLNAEPTNKAEQEPQRKPSPSKAQNQQNVNGLFDNMTLLAPYEDVYRPKIFNSQRNEKSLLIEESRQLGLIPDFSEVANREECCQMCKSYILRNPSLLEEHVRSHMSQPTYGCTFDECEIRHCSRNFIYRHMKEVHKTRKNVHDLMESYPLLMDEFFVLCRFCFPTFFNNSNAESSLSQKRKSPETLTMVQVKDRSKNNNSANALEDFNEPLCIGCQVGLTLDSDSSSCAECTIAKVKTSKGRLFCRICSKFVSGDFFSMQIHAFDHCRQTPFSCSLCGYTSSSCVSIRNHVESLHSNQKNSGAKASIVFSWQHFDWRSMWTEMCEICFSKETKNDGDSFKNGQIYERSCCLCFADVKGGYRVLLDHTLKHLSCPKFACLYCEYENEKEALVENHIRNDHPKMCVVVRSDVSQESADERGRLIALCFPGVNPAAWASSSSSASASPDDKTSASTTILCKLCHDVLPMDEHECLRHVERHINDSIFQCHFCHYKDVDVNRLKMHAQRLHHSPLYSKLTLDNELAAKFSQLMNFCFA